MISIGIDPGKKGAIAAIIDDFVLDIIPMPLITAATKKGKKRGRDEYDLVVIRERLLSWKNGNTIFVTVEKSQPMPPTIRGGVVASFHRGVARGWEWMLAALEIPYQLVAPATWQRAMYAGTPGNDTKQRSILAAQRLFPDIDLRSSPRARKPHDGFAEALLLAEFGRRTYAPTVREFQRTSPKGEPR